MRYVLVTLALGPGAAGHDDVVAAAGALGARVAAVQGGAAASLVCVLDDLAAESDEPVCLVPVAPADRPRAPEAGVSWVRRAAGHWVRTRGTVPVESVSAAVNDLAGFDPDALGALRTRPLTGREAPMTSPAWEQPPEFRHHVLVCRGPRCNNRGGQETAAALGAALSARGLGDDQVLVAQTGCLFPCNRAPVVVTYPDGTWHYGLTADRVAAFVGGLRAGEMNA